MPDIGSPLPSIQLFSTFYAHARRITNNIPTGLQVQERQRKGANGSRSEERQRPMPDAAFRVRGEMERIEGVEPSMAAGSGLLPAVE